MNGAKGASQISGHNQQPTHHEAVPGGGRRPGPAPGKHSQTQEYSGSAKESAREDEPLQHLAEHLRLFWGQDRPPERPLRKCQAGLARVCLWHSSTLGRKPALCFSGTQRPVCLEPWAWVTICELGPGGLGSSPHPPPYPAAGQRPRPRSSGSPPLSVLTESFTRCWAASQNMHSHHPLHTTGPSDSVDGFQHLLGGGAATSALPQLTHKSG